MPRARPQPTESQPLYADDTDSEPESPQPKPNRRSGLKKRLSEVHPAAVALNDDAAEKRRRRKSHKIHIINHEENQLAEGSSSRVARQRLLRVNATQEENQNIRVDVDNYEQWMKLATDNKINAANSWNVALIDYFHDMSLLRNNDDNSINFQRASCTLDGCVKIWTSRVDSVNTETGKLLSNLATNNNNSDSAHGTGGADDDEDGDGDGDGDGDDPKEKRPKKGKGSTLAKDPESLQTKKLDLEFSVDPLFKKTCADFDEGGAQGLLMNHLSLGLGADGSMRVVFDASDTMVHIQDDEDDGDEATSVLEPKELMDFSSLRHFIPRISDLDHKVVCPSLEEFSFASNPHGILQDESAPFYADDTLPHNDYDDDDENEAFPSMDVQESTAADIPPEEDFFTGADAINEDYGFNGGAWDGGSQDEHGDEGGGGAGGSEGEDRSHSGSTPPGPGTGTGPAPGGPAAGPYVNFDPRKAPNPRDLVMAMNDGDGGAGAGGGGMMDYFDQNMLKNWAGPEHWKTRRVLRTSGESKSSTTTKRKQPKEKEIIKIDFSNPLEPSLKHLKETIFAPPDKLSSLNLPKSRKSAAAGDEGDDDKSNLLPNDMHFDCRQLVTLFLKPKFTIKMRQHGVSLTDEGGGGPVDEAYWARGAAEAAKENENNGGDDDPFLTQGGGAIPFNTQFLHDDDDDDNNAFDLGFDDPFPNHDGAGGVPIIINNNDDNNNNTPNDLDLEEQDLLAATQGGGGGTMNKRAKVEFVKYARRAKRVDVRKLKENIWNGLGIVCGDAKVEEEQERERDEEKEEEEEEEDEQMEDTQPPKPPPTDPMEGKPFSTVLSGLSSRYPEDKMDDISTSFCFICLLHLANERGLKLDRQIEGLDKDVRGLSVGGQLDDDAGGGGEVDEVVKNVGDIWGLKVYRDPDAFVGL